jgi:hypothetical protein
VHVSLRRPQIGMSRQLLNRSCRFSAHGEMRTERVPENVNPAACQLREHLALEMCARGCSSRDIEAIFRSENGDSLLSRTAVSEMTQALWAECEEFTTHDVSEIDPLYLFSRRPGRAAAAGRQTRSDSLRLGDDLGRSERRDITGNRVFCASFVGSSYFSMS